MDKMSTMLRPAGIVTLVHESLPRTHVDSAVRLAHIFKTSVEEIEARMYPEMTLHGIPIRLSASSARRSAQAIAR
jgi:hypothetical protein